MTKAAKEMIFNKYGGRCAYCGCELKSVWQIDHAISKQYFPYWDGVKPEHVNHIDNLMPACVMCNHYKRSSCVESNGQHVGFRDFMKTFHLRLRKLPKKTTRPQTVKRIAYMQNIAVRYGVTIDKPFSGTFYFDKNSNKQLCNTNSGAFGPMVKGGCT